MKNYNELEEGNTIQLEYEQEFPRQNRPLIARIMQITNEYILAMCAFVNAKMKLYPDGRVCTRHPNSSDWYQVGENAKITILK